MGSAPFTFPEALAYAEAALKQVISSISSSSPSLQELGMWTFLVLKEKQTSGLGPGSRLVLGLILCEPPAVRRCQVNVLFLHSLDSRAAWGLGGTHSLLNVPDPSFKHQLYPSA